MRKIKFKHFCLLTLRAKAGKMQNKFNRAVKLARSGNALIDKLNGQIDCLTVSERSQCALAVKIALMTGIRIGNEESAAGYVTKPHPMSQKAPQFVQTYGLTTLQKQHVYTSGKCLIFHFTGKKQVEQKIRIADPVLVAQIKHLLAAYPDSTNLFTVNDYHVRRYVARYVGKGFKVKDFRTLFANCVASEQIVSFLKQPAPKTKRELNSEVKHITEIVAEKLGNTPGISKRAYIDPDLITAYVQKRWK